MGKAIYKAAGKANEYSEWACNFYNGCSGMCSYCFNRLCRYKHILGGDKPTLKKMLIDEKEAFKIFKKEAMLNCQEIKKSGLFFSFVSDPCLPQTISLNIKAIHFCDEFLISTTLLTKQTWWLNEIPLFPKSTKIGMTLTGHNEFEPNCARNENRISTLKYLKKEGYKTWASIEPVIDFESSCKMIAQSFDCVSHYKIGLLKGKSFFRKDIEMFIISVHQLLKDSGITIYWKDNILQQSEITRNRLPENCVEKNFNF